MFKDPDVVFVGWLHYCAFDLLIGRTIIEDSQRRGCPLLLHALVVVPCLICTMMLGPMGYLLYFLVSRAGCLDRHAAAHREKNS